MRVLDSSTSRGGILKPAHLFLPEGINAQVYSSTLVYYFMYSYALHRNAYEKFLRQEKAKRKKPLAPSRLVKAKEGSLLTCRWFAAFIRSKNDRYAYVYLSLQRGSAFSMRETLV